MKLLLDENLSRRLIPALQQRFPGSSQVARVYRPKLTRLALGNASNDEVLSALPGAADRLESALSQADNGVVVIGGAAAGT